MTRGEWVDPAAGRITFGELASEWLDGAAHLKPKTRNSYASLLRTRVLPSWQRVPVGKITHEAVAGWVAAGLSASRIRQSVYVVSAVCEYAVRTTVAVVDAVARWLDEQDGEEYAYALLGAVTDGQTQVRAYGQLLGGDAR